MPCHIMRSLNVPTLLPLLTQCPLMHLLPLSPSPLLLACFFWPQLESAMHPIQFSCATHTGKHMILRVSKRPGKEREDVLKAAGEAQGSTQEEEEEEAYGSWAGLVGPLMHFVNLGASGFDVLSMIK